MTKWYDGPLGAVRLKLKQPRCESDARRGRSAEMVIMIATSGGRLRLPRFSTGFLGQLKQRASAASQANATEKDAINAGSLYLSAVGRLPQPWMAREESQGPVLRIDEQRVEQSTYVIGISAEPSTYSWNLAYCRCPSLSIELELDFEPPRTGFRGV